MEDAQALIDEIEALARPVATRALRDELSAFAKSARAMCMAILDDPRDLTRARRYVGIYLEGARDATRQFAALPKAARDDAATAQYRALLADLRAGYAKRREDLLLDDRDALDVEVEVLRDRLARDMAAG